jgi:hypothetical protein
VAGGMPTAIHLKGPKAARNQTNLHVTGRMRTPDQSTRKDALILQYLNNVPIDYEQINITSNIAHQILAHIKSHNPNSE